MGLCALVRSQESRRHGRRFRQRVCDEFERVAHGGAVGLAAEPDADGFGRRSLGREGMPVERMWPTKAEQVQGVGSDTHRWKPMGSVRMPFFGKIAAASRWRSIDSRRTAPSKASPVPSAIQRVASATVTGEAITVVVRTAEANSQPERTSGTTT
jgi:hypothetical protein